MEKRTPSELDEAIDRLAEADWKDDSGIIIVNEAPRMPLPTKPDSDPPSTRGVAVTWKKGVRLGQMPPWAVVVMVLGLGAMAGAVWVLTH